MNRNISMTRFFGLMLIFLLYPGVTELFCQETNLAYQEGSYMYFAEMLKETEKILDEDYPISSADLKYLESMGNELQNTPYLDLLAKNRMLLALAEERLYSMDSENRFEELSEMMRIEEEKFKREKRLKAAQTVTITTAIVSFGLFNLFWYLSDATYEEYTGASSQSEADRLKKRMGLYDTLSLVSGGVGVVSLGISIPLISAGSKDKDFKGADH
jgi:hypothetical protein